MDNKYAIFSDLHLGVHQNNSLWHKIANEWSDWFIGELKSKNIEKIIFLGDYFHSRSEISVSTLHVASDITRKFENFEMIMLVGNHCSFFKDKADVHSLSIFKGYPNIQIVDTPKMYKFGNRNVFFCPWGTEYKDMQKCDVLMGHFEIQTFKMNTYKLCEHGFTSQMLGKKAPLIFSGHFHLREERKYDNYRINYVGNPFEMDFGDSESTKGYYIIDFDTLKYDFFENTISPKHKKIKLSEYEEKKEDVGQNIVRIIVDQIVDSSDFEAKTSNIQKMKPLSLSFDNTAVFNPILEQLDEEYDLSGIDIEKAIVDFVNMLDIDDKEKVSKYAIDLYKHI